MLCVGVSGCVGGALMVYWTHSCLRSSRRSFDSAWGCALEV